MYIVKKGRWLCRSVFITCAGSGGGSLVFGNGGTGEPQAMQNRAKGSAGRSAKQNTHLEVEKDQ